MSNGDYLVRTVKSVKSEQIRIPKHGFGRKTEFGLC